MEKSFDPVKILQEESKKGTLFFVGLDFYKDAGVYLSELERELYNIKPDSTKYAIIEDKLKANRVSIESILSQRMRKIIKQAQIDVFNKDMNLPETLTPEEIELYTKVLDIVNVWKSLHIDPIFKKVSLPDIKINPVSVEISPQMDIRVDVKEKPVVKYIIVRVLQNIPCFVGIDLRNYILLKEDVVTVPVVNAKGLIDKKVAVEIKR